MNSDLATTRIDTFDLDNLEQVIRGLHKRYVNTSPELSWEDYVFVGLTSAGYGWFAIVMYFGAAGFDLGASQVSPVLSEIIKVGGPVGSAITNFFLSVAFATGADKLIFKWLQRFEFSYALLMQGKYASAILELIGVGLELISTGYVAYLSAIPYSALGDSIKDKWAPLASVESQWVIKLMVMVFHLKVSNKYANKLLSHASILLEHVYVGFMLKYLPSWMTEPLLQYWHAQQLEGIDLGLAQRVCEIVSYEHGHLENKGLSTETINLLNELDSIIATAPNSEKKYQSLNIFSAQLRAEAIALSVAALNVDRVVEQYKLTPSTLDQMGKWSIFAISVTGFAAYFRVSAIDKSFTETDLMASFTTIIAFCEDSAEGFWDLLKSLWSYYAGAESEAAGNPLLRDKVSARVWYGAMALGTVLAIFSIMVTLNLANETMLTADDVTPEDKDGVQIFNGVSTYLFNGFGFIDPIQAITVTLVLGNLIGSDAVRKLLLTSSVLKSALAGLSRLPNDVSVYWQERLATKYSFADAEQAEGHVVENTNNFLPSNSAIASLAQLAAGGAVMALYGLDKFDFSFTTSALFFLKVVALMTPFYTVSEYCKKDPHDGVCANVLVSFYEAVKTASKASVTGFVFSTVFLAYIMHYFKFNNFYVDPDNGGQIPGQDEGIVTPDEAIMLGSLVSGFAFVDYKPSSPSMFSALRSDSADTDSSDLDSIKMPLVPK